MKKDNEASDLSYGTLCEKNRFQVLLHHILTIIVQYLLQFFWSFDKNNLRNV